MNTNSFTVCVLAAALALCTIAAPAAEAGSTAANGAPVTRARLLTQARAAIHADHKLSVAVLWTNAVPKKQNATAGPALTSLRQAAADRKRRGIRIRLVSERFRILTLRLDTTYTTATATISDRQVVRPYHAKGGPLGKPITLDEHARLTLHRVGRSSRFVVWKVS